MTVLTDSTGQPLPAVEAPSPDRLRIYGDMMFLAFRSKRHVQMSTGVLRRYIEPPVELGQFRVFRFDDVPRAMFTWAWMGREAEERLLTGEPLLTRDWSSGQSLWIIDMIAPYPGLTQQIGRWVMQRGNFTDRSFAFRRVAGTNDTRRVVHVDFDRDGLGRIFDAEGYLAAARDGTL